MDTTEIYLTEAEKIIHREKLQQGNTSPGDDLVLECCATGESGDAKLFCHLFRDQYCFDHAQGQWYRFVGPYWELCKKEEPLALCEQLIKSYEQLRQKYYRRKLSAMKNGDEQEEKKAQKIFEMIQKKITRLRSRLHRKNVLILAAAGENSLGISGEEWDCHPTMLPCKNVIVNLETGQERPGRPEDYILKYCPVPFEGLDAPCPLWERFLWEVFEDEEKSTSSSGFLGTPYWARSSITFL